jgi:cytochrome P450
VYLRFSVSCSLLVTGGVVIKRKKGLNNWLRTQIRSHLAAAKQIHKQSDMIDIAIDVSNVSLSLEEYTMCAKSFLFAGHDTTSTLLSWLYYCLAQYPEVINKMKEEHDWTYFWTRRERHNGDIQTNTRDADETCRA